MIQDPERRLKNAEEAGLQAQQVRSRASIPSLMKNHHPQGGIILILRILMCTLLQQRNESAKCGRTELTTGV